MKLSRLYFEEGMENKFDLFLKRNEERILSLLPPSISKELSLFYLQGGKTEHRRLFEDLGLISGMSLTERGKKLISAYPLLGSGEGKRGNYSSSFFPFLFSLLSQNVIPRRYERYISSLEYLSLFPWRETDEITEVTRSALSSLLSLKIVRVDSNHLSLDKKASINFMERKEIEKLTFIFSPNGTTNEREKIKNYLTLVSLINGVEKDDIEKVLSLIESITDTSLPLETLTLWGLLKEENSIYSAPILDDYTSQDGVVSADMTLSFRGSTSIPLWRFALPLKADSLNQWSITKRSIKAAFDSGMTKNQIISYLSSLSTSDLPSVIVERIEGWEKEYKRIKIDRAIVLEADDRISILLNTLPQIQRYILSYHAPNLFIMDGEDEDEWREILASCGFEMLPETKGPYFEREANIPYIQTLQPSPTLPTKRMIPYKEEEREKLINNSKDFIKRTMAESFVLFSSKTTLNLEWIDGLEYRSKRERVLSAINEDDNLILLWVDGKEITTKPLYLKERDDGDDLYTTDGVFDLSKIWKLSQIPGYIMRGRSDSSDSDNL